MKNTVRKIKLEGELGEKFGKVWDLNVKTPHEAIRAIECQTKGFRKHILDNAEKGIGYEVIIGDQGIKQEEELLYPAPMREDFTIVPIVQGAKSRGFGMILMGAALFIASGGMSAITTAIEFGASASATAGATTGQVIAAMGEGFMASANMGVLMGGAMMAGGAAMLLAPTIDGSAGNDEQSYLFDGAINSVKQGTPVPVLYGRMIVGGSVISASIKSNQETAGVRGRGRRYVSDVGGGNSTVSNNACFDKGTLVQMADGTEKAIELIKLGDITKGGEVYGTHRFIGGANAHDYRGVIVSGTHWVVENGKTLDVQDSLLAKKISYVPEYWYTLTTETNRIWIKNIEFYDEGCMDFTSLNKYAQALINKDKPEIEKWSKESKKLGHGLEERFIGI